MTTITLDITGFEEVLAKAYDYQKSFYETRGLSGGPESPEHYLQQLMDRQLQGLAQANTHIPPDATLEFAAKQGLKARNSTIDKLG